MKIKLVLFILGLAFIWLACKSDTTKSEDLTILKGGVYYLDDDNDPTPVDGALVNVQNLYAQTVTDDEGLYTLEFELDTDEKDLVIHASKVGFLTSEVSVLAKKGESIQVADFTLQKATLDTGGTPTDTSTRSGPAAHISVFGTHETHIYVTQSGLKESALIEFRVTDDQGRLLDQNNRATVYFTVLNGPGGGEFVAPDSMTTRNGKCYTVLNSGTIAGPVQIEARINGQSGVIKTVPIQMAIYGGLPDNNHFSLALEKINIAGRVHFGIIDNVTAFVGDKYSNPVAPGTAVYFSTNYGIVEGAAVTDNMGRATVRYMSSAPLPPVPAINSFANITAWTYGDTLNYISIYDSAKVLLSDVTDAIFVNPTTFSYTELNEPKQFTFRVEDIWDNPLVSETKILVEASNGNLYGDVNLELNDYQLPGPGRTEFEFIWTPGDSLEDPIVFISIKATPPPLGNGYQSTSISGNRNW